MGFFKMIVTNRIESELRSIAGFSATKTIVGANGSSALAIDDERRRICLFDNCAGTDTVRIASFKDLLSAEVSEDGTEISKTVRKSQIKGLVVGGVLLGSAGAIVGGLSGKRRTQQNVHDITLRLILNDAKHPIFELHLLEKDAPKGSSDYVTASREASYWHTLMRDLIKHADEESEKATSSSVPLSVADELKKLADLLNAGVLTKEEFQQLKTRLVGTSLQSDEPAASTKKGEAGSSVVYYRAEEHTADTLLNKALYLRAESVDKHVILPTLARLISEYPNTSEASEARSMICSSWSSKELYEKASYLHLEEGRGGDAYPLYTTVVECFPSSAEAADARIQHQKIEEDTESSRFIY